MNSGKERQKGRNKKKESKSPNYHTFFSKVPAMPVLEDAISSQSPLKQSTLPTYNKLIEILVRRI